MKKMWPAIFLLLTTSGLALADDSSDSTSHIQNMVDLSRTPNLILTGYLKYLAATGRSSDDLKACVEARFPMKPLSEATAQYMKNYVSEDDSARLVAFFGSPLGQRMAAANGSADFSAMRDMQPEMRAVLGQDPALQESVTRFGNSLTPIMHDPTLRHVAASNLAHLLLHECVDDFSAIMTTAVTRFYDKAFPRQPGTPAQ